MPLTSPLGLPAPEKLAALAASFEKRRYVRLPGLLRAELLAKIQARMSATTWAPWINGKFDVRETPDDDFLNVAVPVLLNDERLFRTVETLCGVKGIRRLTGRVYRLRPAARSGHFCDWHKDSENGARLASMTILLGAKPFIGGGLELRRVGSPTPFARPAYGAPGDALLFDVGPDLEHRSAPVAGRAPKDILACWFHLR